MILIIDSDDDGESLVWECLEQKRTVAVMKAQGVIEKKSIAPTQSVGNRKRNPAEFLLMLRLIIKHNSTFAPCLSTRRFGGNRSLPTPTSSLCASLFN